MFGRTYAVIMAKKTRMCARFGHLPPRRGTTFMTATQKIVAYYCARCGECCARVGDCQ